MASSSSAPTRSRGRQNPSECSTEEPIDLLQDRFSSYDNQRKYFTFFQYRPLLKMRNFDYRNTPVERIITRNHWMRLATGWGKASSHMVKEFYSNFSSSLDHITVRGKRFVFDSNVINTFLGLPTNRPDQFEFIVNNIHLRVIVEAITVSETHHMHNHFLLSGQIDHEALKPHLRFWNNFVCHNLIPTKHTNDVNVQRARLLYAMESDIYIDVGRVIYNVIEEAIKEASDDNRRSDGLPFGSFLTALMLDHDVSFEGGLDFDVTKDMTVQKIRNTLNAPGDNPPPALRLPAPPTANSQNAELLNRMTEMQSQMNRIELQVQDGLNRIDRIEHQVRDGNESNDAILQQLNDMHRLLRRRRDD